MESAGETSPVLERNTLDAEASPANTSSNSRKNVGSKESGNSLLNSVNKHTSQIKKPHRKNVSPLYWFPRKKTDSFLKRKLRLLQEAGGMSSTLEEILDSANPHYSRMMREKIAAREAATKAMEARKAAMVEGSWCRILQAARIQSKEAESKLDKAKKHAAEAFEAARAMGVMMYDMPDCPGAPCEIQTSSAIGGKPTHTVTASFETAFEVDKEVAAAVKKAFIRLASCPSSSNKEEFRNLLLKISQNPDSIEADKEISEVTSECEFDPGSELDAENAVGDVFRKSDIQTKETRDKNKHDKVYSSSPLDLVTEMLDRLKCLQEDQLASLAVIVATCGLSAALLEVDGGKDHDMETITDNSSGSVIPHPRNVSSLGTSARRFSSVTKFIDGNTRKEAVTKLPSLDKFLVKHVSKLEREVQEARKKEDSRAAHQRTSGASVLQVVKEEEVRLPGNITSLDSTSDLGSILVKHVSRLEREIQKAKSHNDCQMVANGKGMESVIKKNAIAAPAPEAFVDSGELVKHSSNVELDTEQRISDIPLRKESKESRNSKGLSEKLEKQVDKENIDLNTKGTRMSRIERAKLETQRAFLAQDRDDDSNQMNELTGLDKILVKPVHRLEKEKMQALEKGNRYTIKKENRKQGNDVAASESLDKILVKHVSRLEKEKMALSTTGDLMTLKKRDQLVERNGESLDEILVKPQSKLEKAKLVASQQSADDHIKLVDARKEARERELLEAWGGLSLGNSMRPHLSRLERDKAAWRRAEEEERTQRPAMEL
ncbi:hypothetical protein J5N97_008524 [Dioscorea zingiberensis]|uniref:Uncharacterized protein n=1 Tax=Dioscorea zingiberensis TaxID=325984 RepID=A0A9D5HKV5_9LILI|nr:hypothetical protein J5N97_008524 [Dioscorea zingiberensis]